MKIIAFSRRFWILTTAIVVFFTLIFVGQNLLHAWRIKRQIAVLEKEEELYLKNIERDSALVNQLRYDDYLEEYAREQYGMQRKGEEVFIIR